MIGMFKIIVEKLKRLLHEDVKFSPSGHVAIYNKTEKKKSPLDKL